MSKKILVLGLVLAVMAAFGAPAGAAKKKKKGPKPFKSETITAQIGHIVLNGPSGGNIVSVTAQEFMNTCSIPTTNGVDAAVFEVPKEYQNIMAEIEATGVGTTDAVEPADVDIYLFDSECAIIGQFNAASPSPESGVTNKGTAFVLLHNYLGGPTDLQFTLKPY